MCAGAYTHGNGITGTSQLVVDEARRRDRRRDVHRTRRAGTAARARRSRSRRRCPLDELWHAVPSFPTISEVWLRLLETYGL